ncbi:MAG: N-acetylglucosamine-6-phosphate deacetylase [Anaerolineae bacterium]|nr:N-acetylglucosamine-6-phosphate deacetylase [Anaerolineae bacterium]
MSSWAIVGRLVRHLGQLEHGTVVVSEGRIAAVLPSPPPRMTVIDVGDNIVAPGLIDLQLNGAFGHDFTLDPATVRPVADGLAQYGCTAFLPTLITSPLDTYPARLQAIADAMRDQAASRSRSEPSGAAILGVHIEGPFISPGKKGAHNPAHLRRPSVAAVKPLAASGIVRLLTLAPELPGALETSAYLRGQGVVVSLGHSEANYETARAALKAGAGWATHLFNAMPTLGHREPGLVGALLEADTPPVGLIADGVHVHPAIIRLVWRAKGMAGICLVTDAMAALGMPPGRYRIGDQDVQVDETSARLVERDTLAGSILSLDQAIRNMVQFTRCSPGQAIWMASGVPAAVLGLTRKGRLASGYDADLVVFDAQLRVQRTFIAGQTVYEAIQGVESDTSTLHLTRNR